MASTHNSESQRDAALPHADPVVTEPSSLEQAANSLTLTDKNAPSAQRTSNTEDKPDEISKLALGATFSVESAEDGGVIFDEMEFDPENTPRDPVAQDSRTDSVTSVSSEDCVAQQADESVIVRLSLNTIPVEILLHICDFLEAGTIINTLTKVCQAFHDLFTNEAYWRIRMAKRWPKKYPPVDYEEIDWHEACVQCERSHRVWSQPEEHMEHFTYNDALFAAVDVVHLMQGGRLLVAGSRDRYLTLLDVSKYDSSRPESKKDMKLHCINKAHNGWIWSMASLDSHLYTGSWDTKIKVWDLEQECEVVTTYKCKSAVLDLHVEPNFIVGGGFDKKVYFIDPRQRGIISTKRWHRQPVLCIAADDNYIISGSEDKTFSVYDRRAGYVFKSVQVENYPLDISYHSNQLWFGDKMGNLNLMDTSLGKFELVQTYNVGHTEKLTGVIHTEGAIYTSSNDSTAKVLEPSLDPQPITTLKEHNSGLAGIAYQNGVLATAGCDISVGIWRPKNDWGWSGV